MKRDYLSVSALKAFKRSPNHYIQYVSQDKRPPSPAMIFGNAAHTLVLEPHEFPKRYLVGPEVDRRTKAGKTAWAEFDATLGERTALTQSDWERLSSVQNAVRVDTNAQKILAQAQTFEDDRTEPLAGVPFRGIADITGKTWVADLKTTKDASPAGFQRSATNLGYHLQAAAYCRLFEVQHFYWVAVETEAPWNVMVYRQHPDALAKSDQQLLQLIQAWKDWDGTPSSYRPQILDLELPRWAS